MLSSVVYHLCFLIPSTISTFCDIRYSKYSNVVYSLIEISNHTFMHAESPVWDPDTDTLYWVDVLNQSVHSFNYHTGNHQYKHISYGQVNIVLPIKDSHRLLVGVRSELYLLDWQKPGDSALRLVALLDVGFPDNVANEGKSDALGRFWGGTKGPKHGMALYSLEEPHFTPRVQVKPVTISNGLTWSLNNTLMYYVDSFLRKIEAFDFDLAKGRLSNRRTIFDLNLGWSDPVIADGMTIDKDGFLWVALMYEGSVIRIDPDRRSVVANYLLPVTLTTSVTWAGPALDSLIVTTSKRNLNDTCLQNEPLAGSIFILNNLGTTGVPVNKLVFPDADSY